MKPRLPPPVLEKSALGEEYARAHRGEIVLYRLEKSKFIETEKETTRKDLFYKNRAGLYQLFAKWDGQNYKHKPVQLSPSANPWRYAGQKLEMPQTPRRQFGEEEEEEEVRKGEEPVVIDFDEEEQVAVIPEAKTKDEAMAAILAAEGGKAAQALEAEIEEVAAAHPQPEEKKEEPEEEEEGEQVKVAKIPFVFQQDGPLIPSSLKEIRADTDVAYQEIVKEGWDVEKMVPYLPRAPIGNLRFKLRNVREEVSFAEEDLEKFPLISINEDITDKEVANRWKIIWVSVCMGLGEKGEYAKQQVYEKNLEIMEKLGFLPKWVKDDFAFTHFEFATMTTDKFMVLLQHPILFLLMASSPNVKETLRRKLDMGMICAKRRFDAAKTENEKAKLKIAETVFLYLKSVLPAAGLYERSALRDELISSQEDAAYLGLLAANAYARYQKEGAMEEVD